MTLFNSVFTYYQIARAGFDEYGRETSGAVSVSTVKGTIQPLNATETAAMAEGGDRQTGTIKIYTSQRLAFRHQEEKNSGNISDNGGNSFEAVTTAQNFDLDFSILSGNIRGYVKDSSGVFFEIVSEQQNQNGLIPHYKYTACRIPVAQIPGALNDR